jgi:hypothetical protein
MLQAAKMKQNRARRTLFRVKRPSTWLGTVSLSLDSARDPELAEGSNREA